MYALLVFPWTVTKALNERYKERVLQSEEYLKRNVFSFIWLSPLREFLF